MGKNQLLTDLHSFQYKQSKIISVPKHKQDSKVIPQQTFITTDRVFHTDTIFVPEGQYQEALCSSDSLTQPSNKRHAPFIFHSIYKQPLRHKTDSKSYFSTS